MNFSKYGFRFSISLFHTCNFLLLFFYLSISRSPSLQQQWFSQTIQVHIPFLTVQTLSSLSLDAEHSAQLCCQPHGFSHKTIRNASYPRFLGASFEFLVHDRVNKFLVHYVRSVSAYLRRHLVTCEN
ncbi:hypothetical protein DER46DRAFT_289968 [Fusarium sp. MPI-SDFR-AT-0072]|nr:hypothetical protein DER46DRAFT_289968 [Fusarium sp. MPI-SDFR-AT-0072]